MSGSWSQSGISGGGAIAFATRAGALWAEDVPIETIAANVGSPVFVYSAATLRERARAVREAFEPLGAEVRFAVKANPNLSVLRLLVAEGCGMDVVSGGELHRARLAGCAGGNTCFAGVSKSQHELHSALGIGTDHDPVGLINIESESELRLLDRIAGEAGVRADALIRVNPDVDAQTHRYTTTGITDSKFGVDPEQAVELFRQAREFPGVRVRGLHAHIGSPIREPGRYAAAAGRLAELASRLRSFGAEVSVLNLGGGFAHSYGIDPVAPVAAYAEAVRLAIGDEIQRGTRLLVEPGRVIAAGAGVLIVRVVHVKENPHRAFALCDAGMNALARPALYQAEHRVEAVRPREGTPRPIDIAGPLCESSDFLARGRTLPPVRSGDLLAVFEGGAYGMSMASNYNDHPKPAEVLVDGDRWAVIRERQTFDDLVRHDRAPDWQL